MTLEWGDPPPQRRRASTVRDWQAIATELRARPGVWALVAEDTSYSTAAFINTGRITAMPRGEFQGTARATETNPRLADVWARYVGDVTGE